MALAVTVAVFVLTAADPGATNAHPLSGLETSHGQETLSIAIAQREAQIEPDGALDDRRKPASAIGDGDHDRTL